MKALTLVLALLLTSTACLAFQADPSVLPPQPTPTVKPADFNPLIDDEVVEENTVKKTALRAYMIQQKTTQRWLRRTIPFQVNIWIFDRGVASIYTNKQEAHQVWMSLGFPRTNAEIKTFMLVPIENED
jgi:hypothetical protein